MFVLEINHCDGQTSRPRFQWTFPQKTASLPTNDTVRQCPVYWWRLFYHVIQSEKLCHFPGCLVGQVGLVWINREDTGETPWKNTVTAAILTALWLKHRMKHISSRSSYLSSRKAENQLICIYRKIVMSILANITAPCLETSVTIQHTLSQTFFTGDPLPCVFIPAAYGVVFFFFFSHSTKDWI